MVVLAVTWMAKVGREAEVTALFAKLTEESRKEPGCAMYQVHRHKTEARRFFIYEQYQDDAALEAHRTAPHFLQYARKDLPKIADRVEGHLYEPLGRLRGAGALATRCPVTSLCQTSTRRPKRSFPSTLHGKRW
jgi:autoinducer 2-degrading protein